MLNAPVYPGEGLENQKEYLRQEVYISEEKERSPDRISRINQIATDLGKMRTGCQMAVCIPAYRESGIIANTLRNYTIFQTDSQGARLSPDVFEINILINRPNDTIEHDYKMLEEIQAFQASYPEYQINIASVTYDFPKKPIIGTIFKDIADAVIVRNLERNIPDNQKSRLILRTAGADVEALNPLLLSRTLATFADPSVVAHRGETRLPPELLQSFPLLHVMQTFAVFLLRQYHGGHTTNGPFSYTAEAYASVGGFNPEKALGEEIDLAQRIWKTTRESQGKVQFTRDCIKDVLNNPRRQVHALLAGAGMAGRYQKFGESLHENQVHSMSTSWRTIRSEILPESCLLTESNLSREVSGYYRTYLRMASAAGIPKETINKLFIRGFVLSGITHYSIHQSSEIHDSHIEIHNISPLLGQMAEQTFAWAKTFSAYPSFASVD